MNPTEARPIAPPRPGEAAGAPHAATAEPRTGESGPARPLARTPRLDSLDAFRGATIAAMLLVNNPGSWSHIYAPLRHAEWHGWTPTDLIFPFFLFIVGVSMVFSLGGQLARGASRAALFRKAGRRALILFGLGLVLHGFPKYDLATIRIPGVLQRIAWAYLPAAAILLTLGVRGQALIAGALLLTYWALLTLVPVPGIGAGVLEPGQDLGAFIDRLIFTTDHLWAYSRTWDPEGLLSTLPAIATVLFGALAGHWLRSERSGPEKAAGLFAAGTVALALGAAWGAVFPINKNLWTSSYAVFTTGMALHALGICYWLIDVHSRKRWAKPFIIFGTNAITAFFLSSLTARILGLVRWQTDTGTTTLKAAIHDTLFVPWLRPVDASLAFAIGYVLFWLAFMAVLYRRKIFIKV